MMRGRGLDSRWWLDIPPFFFLFSASEATLDMGVWMPCVYFDMAWMDSIGVGGDDSLDHLLATWVAKRTNHGVDGNHLLDTHLHSGSV